MTNVVGSRSSGGSVLPHEILPLCVHNDRVVGCPLFRMKLCPDSGHNFILIALPDVDDHLMAAQTTPLSPQMRISAYRCPAVSLTAVARPAIAHDQHSRFHDRRRRRRVGR